MKTNGIPRCPRQRDAMPRPPPQLLLPAASWAHSESLPGEGCFCKGSPLQKLGAYYFELFQKRKLLANQNAALVLAYFQTSDSFVESKSAQISPFLGCLLPQPEVSCHLQNRASLLLSLESGMNKGSHKRAAVNCWNLCWQKFLSCVANSGLASAVLKSCFPSADVLTLAGCVLVCTHLSSPALHFHDTR